MHRLMIIIFFFLHELTELYSRNWTEAPSKKEQMAIFCHFLSGQEQLLPSQHSMEWNCLSKTEEIKEMKAAFHSSVKSGLFVGTATTIGGLLFGPSGLAIGGIFSSLTSAYAMNGKFQSVPDILINKASNEHKILLAIAIRNVLTQQNILTIADFALKVATYDSIVGLIIPIVKGFLENDLKATIMQ